MMDSMETIAHVRNVLKLAAVNMVYSSDGKIAFEHDTDETEEGGEG